MKTRGSEPWRSIKLRQNMNQLESYLPERRIKGAFIQYTGQNEGQGRKA